jgi:hypothetical protein
MQTYQLYIDGAWRAASDGATIPAIKPCNPEVHAHIAGAVRMLHPTPPSCTIQCTKR